MFWHFNQHMLNPWSVDSCILFFALLQYSTIFPRPFRSEHVYSWNCDVPSLLKMWLHMVVLQRFTSKQATLAALVHLGPVVRVTCSSSPTIHGSWFQVSTINTSLVLCSSAELPSCCHLLGRCSSPRLYSWTSTALRDSELIVAFISSPPPIAKGEREREREIEKSVC